MTDTFIQSGAVEVKSINLSDISGKKNYSLTGQVLAFNIYEDILFPVVRADFLFSDALGLITEFPIIGEEIIDVEFVTAGYDETLKYRLHVKSISPQQSNAQAKSTIYMVTAISQEFITNGTTLVTKKYSSSASDIVKNIMKDFLKTEKNVYIGDLPKGTQEVLVSRLKPFQAIDMVRRRSVSEKYQSSSYVFYENQKGFYFSSIESLMDNMKEKVNGRIYFHDTAPNTDTRNMNTRNLLDFKIVSQVNNTTKLAQGSLNNVVKKFDLMTGETIVTEYKNLEKQSQFKFASEKALPTNSTLYEQTYGSEPANIMIVPSSSHLPETFTAESIGAKFSFATKIAQNIFHATVYGDSALSVGDVIEIKITNQTGSTGEIKENRLISGTYLISKVRHNILMPQGTNKEYYCALELIKGSYEDNA